jgi:hypothetical protein
MKYLRIIAVLLLCSDGTLAQVQHGTTIVINRTDDKIMVAADSRDFSVHDSPDDCVCKITALGKYTIYAASGFANYRSLLGFWPSWNSSDEARKAYISVISRERENDFAGVVAKEWGRLLVFNWSLAYKRDPALVLQLASTDNGNLVHAFFGSTDPKGKNVVALFTNITVDPKRFPVIVATEPIENPNGNFWTLGLAEMVTEFLNPQSEMTKLERVYQKMILTTDPPDADIWKIARYVQLEITYHVPAGGPTATNEVGGSVDAVILQKGKGVRWFSRKSTCPAE